MQKQKLLKLGKRHNVCVCRKSIPVWIHWQILRSVVASGIQDIQTLCYAGFVDLGNIHCNADEQLASESVFRGLTVCFFQRSYWIFLVKKNYGHQLVNSAICLFDIIICDAGLNGQAVVCDGAYTNKSTATYLGCNFTHNEQDHFPNFPRQWCRWQLCLTPAPSLTNERTCLGDINVY